MANEKALRDALQALTNAVGSMKAPKTIADVALQLSVTIGPAYAHAKQLLAGKVGCEGPDGLLRVHPEDETCDVCRHTIDIPEISLPFIPLYMLILEHEDGRLEIARDGRNGALIAIEGNQAGLRTIGDHLFEDKHITGYQLVKTVGYPKRIER